MIKPREHRDYEAAVEILPLLIAAAALTAAGGIAKAVGGAKQAGAERASLFAQASADYTNADVADLNGKAVLDFGEINASTILSLGDLNAKSTMFAADLQSKATLGFAGINAHATEAIGELNASSAERASGLNIEARDTVGAYNGAVADANYNLTMAAGKFNQDAAEIQATAAEDRGRQQVSQTQQRYGAVKSSQIASLAANGVALDSDSSLRVLTSTDWQKEVDTSTIAVNAAQAANGFRVQGQLAMNDATIRGLAIKADALGAKFNIGLADLHDASETALYAGGVRATSTLQAMDTRTTAQATAMSLTAEAQNTALNITTSAGLSAMDTRNNATMTALGYRTQAANFRSAGDAAMEGRSAVSPTLTLLGGVASTAGQVASMFKGG